MTKTKKTGNWFSPRCRSTLDLPGHSHDGARCRLARFHVGQHQSGDIYGPIWGSP